MRKLIVANWKENPVTEQEALALFAKTAAARWSDGTDVVICPPSIYLGAMAKKIKALRLRRHLALGTQDVFWKEKGPYTGGAGPTMLRSLGTRYAIIGHSERRKFFRETDMMVNKKVHAALAGGLTAILCVGEPLPVRKKGIGAAKRFIKNQLIKDLKGIKYQVSSIRKLIVAYEPIWAIGTGRNANPADAAEMAKFIRKTITTICRLSVLSRVKGSHVAILYGGSVNGKNIKEYVSCKGIDGALVGGASLDAGEFRKIIESTAKRRK